MCGQEDIAVVRMNVGAILAEPQDLRDTTPQRSIAISPVNSTNVNSPIFPLTLN